jgi:hypothetical protein
MLIDGYRDTALSIKDLGHASEVTLAAALSGRKSRILMRVLSVETQFFTLRDACLMQSAGASDPPAAESPWLPLHVNACGRENFAF